MHRSMLATSLALCLASIANAEEPPPPIFTPAKISLSAEPGVWYVAPSGRVRFPTTVGTSDFEYVHDLRLDYPRLSPFVELNANTPRWGGTLRATTMSANNREFTTYLPTTQLGDTTLAQGTVGSASLDYLEIEAEVRYSPFPYWKDLPETRSEKHWDTFDHRFDLVAGVRLVDFAWDVTQQISGSISPVAHADETYLIPYVGIKGSVIIDEKLTIDLTSNAGGMTGFGGKRAFAWDILVGFQYHVTENLGAQIGYRQVLLRLRDTDSQFRWDGAQAGLYFGLVARF